LAAREAEIRSGVIEFLSPMQRDRVLKLFGKAIAVAGPVKGESCEYRSHGVIGVGGDASVWAKGEQDVRTELSDVKNQSTDYAIEILAMQMSVGIIEDNAARNFEDFARGGEFLSADCGQLLVPSRAAAMRSGLTGRKANDACFHSAVMI